MLPENMNPNLKPVDVICQFDRKGVISPLKIRVVDEDGEYQSYKIEKFLELKHPGAVTLSDGVFASGKDSVFECYITVYGNRKMIRLYFKPDEMIWMMTIA